MVRYLCSVIEEFWRAKPYKSLSELLKICELSQEKMSSVFEDSDVYMLHVMYQVMSVCTCKTEKESCEMGRETIKPYHKQHSLYPLSVASLWSGKLGRLCRGLGTKAAREKALKAIVIMEGAQTKIIPTFLRSNGKLKATETMPTC